MWNCLCYIGTFFGQTSSNDPDEKIREEETRKFQAEAKINLERQVNFLVFWGKLDRESVIRMPIRKRKLWIDLTIEQLRILYGTNDKD